ncbi:MAG: glycosyltransferase family 1 protein [Minisyncoccia bacterium]
MNIAIDSRSLESPKTGVGRYLSNLLKYWKNEKEHKFTLYFKDKIPENDYIKSDNFDPKILKNPFGFSSNLFFQHFLLPYHLKKDDADFFFSPFYLKPIYCPVKSSIVLHDISYEAHPEWFDPKSQFILRKMSKLSAGKASMIFTVSDYTKQEIMKYYKLDPEKIIVAHLGIDGDFVKITDDAKIEEIKEKYGISDKYILSVGSFFTRRHIPEIIDAFGKAAVERGDYQLLLVGKNHTYPFADIKKKIAKVNENIGRRAIIHADFISESELSVLYSGCEFVVYLSDYEGFGLPVIEAQFFDKPVITSHNTSLAEVAGDSAEFVLRNTENEIYDSIQKLIIDADYRGKLVLLGRENLKRFSWRKCAEETLNMVLSI